MYYVTAETRAALVPESVLEILKARKLSMRGEGTSIMVPCPNMEAASAVISVISRADMKVGNLAVSGRKPALASLPAAGDN